MSFPPHAFQWPFEYALGYPNIRDHCRVNTTCTSPIFNYIAYNGAATTLNHYEIIANAKLQWEKCTHSIDGQSSLSTAAESTERYENVPPLASTN